MSNLPSLKILMITTRQLTDLTDLEIMEEETTIPLDRNQRVIAHFLIRVETSDINLVMLVKCQKFPLKTLIILNIQINIA